MIGFVSSELDIAFKIPRHSKALELQGNELGHSVAVLIDRSRHCNVEVCNGRF
jgi:hypothetical protein